MIIGSWIQKKVGRTMRLYSLKFIFAIICAFVLCSFALGCLLAWFCPEMFSITPNPIKKRDCNGKHEWRGGYYTMYACSKCGDRWEESETRCKYCNILKKDETVGRYKHRCSGFRRSDDNTAWVDNERDAW